MGPLVEMWMVYQTGSATTESATRGDVQLIIFFGAVSVVIGFVCLGHRIMRVIGKEITEISAARQVVSTGVKKLRTDNTKKHYIFKKFFLQIIKLNCILDTLDTFQIR